MASKRAVKQWADTLEALALGKRNPRALVVETVGQMKRSTSWLSSRWGISMVTYDVVDGNAKWRTRRDDEKPENDPAEWGFLVEQASALETTAAELKAFALAQKRKAEQRLIDGA